MKEYLHSKEDVLEKVKSQESGLTFEEAKKRLEENGRNKLAEGKKESIFHKFLMQLADPMIIILIVAAVISAITSAYAKEFPSDVIIIMVVVIRNQRLKRRLKPCRK